MIKYKIDKDTKADNTAFLKHLKEPTKKIIKEMIDKPQYNTLKYFVGPTGMGKTKNVYDTLIPELFKVGLRYIQYTAPMNEVIEKDKLKDVAVDIGGVYFCDNPEDILNALKRGKKVLACATNSMAWTDSSPGMIKLRNYLFETSNFKDKIAIINDEIHTWLTSHALNYKKNNGNSGGDFSGTMYKLNEKFSGMTSHVYGLTATPTMEQKNELPVIGNLKYERINDDIPISKTFMKKAFKGEFLFYDAENKKSTKKAFKKFIENQLETNNKYGIKTSSIIQCKPNRPQGSRGNIKTEEWQGSIPEMISLYIDICKELKIKDLEFGIMTSDGNRNYKVKDNNLKTGGNVLYKFDDCYKPILVKKFKNTQSFTNYFDNQDNKALFLFMIERGKCGMNIHGLKNIFSTKEYKTKKKETVVQLNGETVHTETIEQLAGRAARLNIPGGKSELDRYNFDAIKYVQENPDKIPNFIASNTMNISCPNNSVWKESLNRVDKGMIKPEEIEFDLSINCPYCNGTGKTTFPNCDKKTHKILNNTFGI